MLNFFLLLILYHGVSSSEVLYSELEYYGGSCYPFDSCNPQRSSEYDHLWNSYTCECGPHCVYSRTCCADSPSIGKQSQWTLYKDESCQKLMNFPEAVLLVSQCGNRWQHEPGIKYKCENAIDKSDPLAVVPVTSLNTHKTYKNYFCAMCNLDVENIFMWNIALEFGAKESDPSLANITEKYILQNLIFEQKTESWGISLNNPNRFYTIKMQFIVPIVLNKVVKKCYPDMIESCEFSKGQRYQSEQKCLSYYAPIRLKIKGNSHFIKYRNIHCAFCNNVRMSDVDGITCKLEADRRRPKPGFSFALLLDINTSDGDVVGQVQLCGENEQWDPFFKKCRSLACALPGYVVRNGKCVKS